MSHGIPAVRGDEEGPARPATEPTPPLRPAETHPTAPHLTLTEPGAADVFPITGAGQPDPARATEPTPPLRPAETHPTAPHLTLTEPGALWRVDEG
ncbi:hypothetical protein E4099_13025, partial [Streptomyces palmae]